MNENRARRLSEAEVIGASLAIVKHVGWTIQKNAEVSLSPDFWNYLYVPEPELLLVPSIDEGEAARCPVTRAVREARSDAMVIEVRKDGSGQRQAIANLAIWSSRGALWYGPCLPWLSKAGELWLVADAVSIEPQPSFRLGDGRLTALSAPYQDQEGRRRGLIAARALVNAAMEG